MKKTGSLVLSTLILLSFAVIPLSVSAIGLPHLMVVEWSVEKLDGKVTLNTIPLTDNSMSNRDYKLLGYKWTTTANYYINPTNSGFSNDYVVVITTSANTWDEETSFQVFAYKGTTSISAGKYDGFNVVSWDRYSKNNVIGVTFIWYNRVNRRILETDTMLNTYFAWSLNGESGKMDVQNIMTHEFGHWCGLADLYNGRDYWLTMYGYSGFGETYKQTLGLGDILGLKKVYGA